MPLPRDPAKLVAVFLELSSLHWVADARKYVGESVFRGRNPFRNESALGHDFACGDRSGHPKPLVVT